MGDHQDAKHSLFAQAPPPPRHRLPHI
jgi:hypothetical protein